MIIAESVILKKISRILAVLPGVFYLVSAMACQASGPPFETPDPANLPAAEIEGRYYFNPPRDIYEDPIAGELYVQKARSGKYYFSLRIAGKTTWNQIRIRSYEGVVVKSSENKPLLRSLKCYLFGKKEWDGKLKPLERWDCEHLAFQLEKLPRNRGYRILSDAWSENGDMLVETDLMRTIKQGASPLSHFSGTLLFEQSDGSKSYIIWGTGADRFFKKGKVVKTKNMDGNPGPTLTMLEGLDDFILCSSQDTLPDITDNEDQEPEPFFVHLQR